MRLRKDDVSWREIDGEIVILDLASSKYLTTNRTGATLVRLLVEERTADELAGALVDEFAIPREQAVRDVDVFVSTLREKGLLDAGPDGSA